MPSRTLIGWMFTMIKRATPFQIARAIVSNTRMIMAKPSIDWFFYRYLRKFTVLDVDGKLILHSHLPPINSRAYSRFLEHHLLSKSIVPSHAQIGVTNICPQGCEYCYNKNRGGGLMNLETIQRVIRELKELGVFWIGLTGGEPLLNKDLAKIIEKIGDECAVKLFTTGITLTRQRALELKNAGLYSVSVSLDHQNEAEHDRIRRYPGAYRIAMDAIDIFKNVGGIHVSVSSVLSRESLKEETIESYLEFLERLGIHEAWLSEAKPSSAEFWRKDFIITPEERQMLVALQDRYNKKGGMTVNYLGHFEDARHFGCTAGHKMIYIDPFGEISPCVFVPMTFGNVNRASIREIYAALAERFPTENECFINKYYPAIQRHYRGNYPLSKEDSTKTMDEITHTSLARFFQLQYR